MKRNHSIWMRVQAVLLALLIVLPCLQVVPVQAEPEGASEDRDDIVVLSTIVNTKTETNEVFTELILQNKGTEDQQITFSLPEVYGGIDLKTLAVKTSNGEELEPEDGEVTLQIRADGFAGISYTYKTKRNLSYERLIGFDLQQLSKQFNDRIGHLEWTVDVPMYELALITEIRPVNYTVDPISTQAHEELVKRCVEAKKTAPMADDYRVKVELDGFLVSSLLKNVYLSKVTQRDLLDQLGEREGEFYDVYRLVYENYRDVYHMDFFDPQTLQVTNTPGEVFEQLYRDKYPERTEEDLSSWSLFHDQSCFFDERVEDVSAYAYLLMKTLWYKLGAGRLTVTGEPNAPALNAIESGTPSVFLTIPTSEPNLAGTPLVRYVDYLDWVYGRWDEGKFVYLEEPEEYDPEADGDFFQEKGVKFYPTDEMLYLSLQGSVDQGGKIRYAYTPFPDDGDVEVLREYINAIHANAVIRLQIVRKESETGRSLLLQGDEERKYAEFYSNGFSGFLLCSKIVFRPTNLAYSETEDYPFDRLEAELKDIFGPESGLSKDYYYAAYPPEGAYTLLQYDDPLKNQVPVPIITEYVGLAYPVEEMKEAYWSMVKEMLEDEDYSVDLFGGFHGDSQANALFIDEFEKRVPLRFLLEYLSKYSGFQDMLAKRDDVSRTAVEENEQLLVQAREALKLPDPEEAIKPIEPTLPEPTEVPTEAPTEAPTETTTEVTTEASTEATTQAVEETTVEVSTEEPARGRGEKETKESSDKNVLVIVLIAVGVVVALAATLTAILVIKKKRHGK